MACRPIVNTNDKKSKKLKILSYPADSLKAPSGLKSVYARAFFFFLANQPTTVSYTHLTLPTTERV